MNQSLESVKKYIKELLTLPNEENIENIDLFENGYIDSLKIFEFISSLEKKFNINFSPEDFEDRRFRTINGIAEIIKEKINALYNK